MLCSDRDDWADVNIGADEEEEKKESSSTSSLVTESSSDEGVELTSNFAFDRFLSIAAYGYANGLVKFIRLN